MGEFEEREIELFCMRPECGKSLTVDQAYFCSQECLDLYDPDCLGSLDHDQREQVRQTATIREERMDRLRAADPTRHLAPQGWHAENSAPLVLLRKGDA